MKQWNCSQHKIAGGGYTRKSTLLLSTTRTSTTIFPCLYSYIVVKWNKTMELMATRNCARRVHTTINNSATNNSVINSCLPLLVLVSRCQMKQNNVLVSCRPPSSASKRTTLSITTTKIGTLKEERTSERGLEITTNKMGTLKEERTREWGLEYGELQRRRIWQYWGGCKFAEEEGRTKEEEDGEGCGNKNSSVFATNIKISESVYWSMSGWL